MLETDVHQLVAILLEDGFESVYDTDQNSLYGLLESYFAAI